MILFPLFLSFFLPLRVLHVGLALPRQIGFHLSVTTRIGQSMQSKDICSPMSRAP